MSKLHFLEVVSGLGVGGAERALLTRMKYSPPNVEQVILNVRPEIDALNLDSKIVQHKLWGWGLRRIVAGYMFFRQHQFDVIIVRTPLDAVKFGFFKILSFTNMPKLVFEAHSNYVSKRFALNSILHFFLRCVFHKIDLIVAVSGNVSEGPQCRGHKNISVVFMGGELRSHAEVTDTFQSARLVFIGRLVEVKRPIWLLERMRAIGSKLSLPKNALTIVGSGPLIEEAQNYVFSHNLSDIVCLVGEQSDVAPFLFSATHLVSCSTNEGLPLTFFEAKLAGLAILATPSGGGAEILGPHDLELKTFDEREFEEALISIFSTPPPTVEHRRQIQADAQSFRASTCAENYYSLVTQLLTKG